MRLNVGSLFVRRVQRQTPRQRETELEVVCGTKRKKKQNGRPEDEPRRLTQEDIRRLGGLREAKRVVDTFQSAVKVGGHRYEEPARAYRKTKKTPEQLAKEKADRKRQEDESERLRRLYGTDREDCPPMLVIDGYNVLAEMVKHERKRFRDKELDEQRHLLETDIRVFSSGRGIRACIVYDALENPYPNGATQWPIVRGVEKVFCSNYEADQGLRIESERFLEDGTPTVTVVTSDIAAREACTRPPFIYCQSAKMFVREVRRCKRELQQTLDLQDAPPGPTRSALKHGLSNQTLSELRRVRDALIRDTE